MNCYNCGTELNSENKTREHIPAKNLFNGYSDEYKKNRIVVPACFDCNNRYSLIDQEIRDVIGILNDDNEQQKEMTRQGVTSIMRRGNWKERVSFEVNSLQNMEVTFSYDDLKELHFKNFKGVFFNEFRIPMPSNFELQTIAEGDEIDQNLINIKDNFKNYLNAKGWKISGHKDVFKYKVIMLDLENPSESHDFSETNDVENCHLIIGEFYYHNTINPFLFGADSKYLDNLSQ
ncbi:hypothetical protein [Chryseobacterium bernardetii]|uniref:hypothetical protein n=1 Tax=Chryseobacterium bernardetii TaxID=1241978 RepID=UPI003AF7D4E8